MKQQKAYAGSSWAVSCSFSVCVQVIHSPNKK